MRKLQQGFTLIELVVVITILGILAAFAIPRFASLDSNARVAAINGLAGSLRSAASLAHSMYLAAGNAPATVTMEGSAVALTNGYPSASTTAAPTTGITAALQDTSSFTPTYIAGPPTGTSWTTSSAATTPASCIVTYTSSTAANTSPVITAVTTGC
jgi:MSHA pilin protein MshA